MTLPFTYQWQYSDGGRSTSGLPFKKLTQQDCVCRAISLTTGLNYRIVYDLLRVGNRALAMYPTGGPAKGGIRTQEEWFQQLMEKFKFTKKNDPLTQEFINSTTIILHLRSLGSGHFATLKKGILLDTWNSLAETKYHINSYYEMLQTH